MRRGHLRIPVIGTVSAIAWTVLFTEVLDWSASMKLVFGVAGLAIIFVLTLAVWMAYTGNVHLLDGSTFGDGNSYDKARREQEEYLRRRAEDARMRDLMNPGSQPPPPTDWYGR